MGTESEQVASVLLASRVVTVQTAEPLVAGSIEVLPLVINHTALFADVQARRMLTSAFSRHSLEADVIAGRAMAGIVWAAWVAESLRLPMTYLRGSAKGYGRGRQIEGANISGRGVVFVEKPINSVEDTLFAIEALRAAGGDVLRCVSLVSWDWPAANDALAVARIPLIALTSIPVLLKIAEKQGVLGSDDMQRIEQWRLSVIDVT